MAFRISVRHVLQLERRPTANSSITSATKISQKRLFGSLVHRKSLTNFLAIIPYNTCLACFHSLIRATANTKPSPPPRRPHLMEIGAGHSRSSKPFPMAGKQKGLGVGARSLGNQPESVSQKVRSPTHWRLPLRSSTLFVDALRLNINVVRQFLKEIAMQDARDVRNDLRVQTVVRNKSVYHRPASSQLLGQPAHRPSLSVELFSDELSYVYHVGLRY